MVQPAALRIREVTLALILDTKAGSVLTDRLTEYATLSHPRLNTTVNPLSFRYNPLYSNC